MARRADRRGLEVVRLIRSFADEATRDIWDGVNIRAARRLPRPLWSVIRRKLDQLDIVTQLDDLRLPPGNRLHALTGDLAGHRAIRVNDQYRIVSIRRARRFNAIVNGRRGVSADTALLFEALTGWDAQIWLALQAKWDLWHALRTRGQRPKVRALPRSA